jgi:CheY-like chemotaxis protein
VRSLLARVLTKAGYRVTLAEDGEAALGKLNPRDPVALVVTDLIMPRLGGDGLHAILRSRPGAPPVLAMSGYARGSTAQAAFEHVLLKPFTPRELLRKVREVLGTHA